MRFGKWILVVTLALVGLATGAHAQSVSDSDFISMQSITLPLNKDTSFSLLVSINNKTPASALSIPLTFAGSPNLTVDTTKVDAFGNKGITQETVGSSGSWTIRSSLVNNTAKTILIGYVSFGVPLPPSNGALVRVHFKLASTATGTLVNVDSTLIAPANRLTIVDEQGVERIPKWTKGVITIGTPQPTISLSPTTLNFSRVIGTGNPPPQGFNISNTGAGTLNWTAVSDTTWLTVAPGSGSGNGPTAVAVNVNIAGLGEGLHVGRVTVSDPAASNTPQIVTVNLTLTRPTIAATPSSLSFSGVAGGANPAQQSFNLTASSSAAILWTSTKTSSRVNYSPTSGTTPSTVNVTPDISGLAAGTYFDTITVSAANASNSPIRIPVIITLTQAPLFVLTPTTIAFTAIQGGANPAPDTIAVTNGGGGTLDFTVATDQPWLFASPGAGTAPQDIQVSAVTGSLAANNYTGRVVFTSGAASNSPETVTVTFNVQSNPPVLDVSPLAMAFSATEGDVAGSPASTPLSINNTGGGVLDFNIVGKDAAWLQLSATSGSAPAVVNISVIPSGLLAGSYMDTIQVTSAGAVGSPTSVVVTLNVAAGPPTIALAPATFTFTAVEGGANPADQALNITNVGGSLPLNWSASAVSAWLSVVPSSGTAPSSPLLKVDITGLTTGSYKDTITVSAAGATNTPQKAAVTLNISEPPSQIVVSPDSLFFTATLGDPDPASQNVAISNGGGGTLNWTSSPSDGWIVPGASAGTAPSILPIGVSLAGLAPGIYNGDVQIAAAGAENSPVRIHVRLVLNDQPPALEVVPTLLNFSAQQDGPNPPAQQFTISNTGGGSLVWSLSTAAGWIDFAPASGINDRVVNVAIDLAGVVAGSYSDSILVDAGSAFGSPVHVVVNLEVAPPPPPSIVLGPTSFVFTGLFGAGNPAAKVLSITNGGGRQLDWTLANSQDWLTATPAAGTAPSNVGLTVDITGLAVGSYYDTVIVSSDSAVNSPQRATVRLDIVENPPVIVVSPTNLLFQIVQGDPDPPLQSFSINNSGAGTLSWSATKKSSWLSLSASAGTAPSVVDAHVATAGLMAGTYRDTVVITSPEATNSPQKVIITLAVKSVAKPAIVLQPDSLLISVVQGQVSLPECIYVFIDGNGGRLVWRARTDADWIDLSRDSCNISYPVCVTVDAFGFEPGVYCDSVEFSGDASNSPQYLKVCMQVTGGSGDDPILVVTDTTYSFTAQEGDTSPTPMQSFSVTNAGGGVLNWTAVPSETWVIMDPLGGTAPTFGTFRVDPTGLAAGTYDATVQFSAPGALNSPQLVRIRLAVTPDVIADVDSVRVGTDSTAPGGSLIIPVYFDNKAPLYGMSVPLTFAGADGIKADSVSFAGTRVAGVDVLAASIDSVAQQIRIGVFPASTPAIPPGSGLLARIYFTSELTAPNQIVIIDSVTTTGPSITLQFVDTSSQVVVPGFRPGSLTVEGEAPPVLAVTPDSLHFTGNQGGANPTAEVLHVSNAGSGSLTFSASEVIPWALISPASGSAGDSVVVSVNLGALTAGSYSGVIEFTSPEAVNSPVQVPVALTVDPPQNAPIIVLAPDQLSFSVAVGAPNPPPDTITVTNGGGGTLAWTATKSAAWLSLSPAAGGSGTNVQVSINAAGLAVGDYFDTIEFTDPAASNSPRTALVELHVTAPAGPDTVFVASVAASAGTTVDVPIRIKNTIEAQAITLPFKYSGVGVKLLTGATLTSRSGPGVFTIFSELIDTVNQTALYGFVAFGLPMAVGDGDVLIMHFQIAADAPPQVITIDTTFLPPSNRLAITDPAATDVFPEFVAGSITVDGGGADAIRISDANGEAGSTVTVDVYAQNSAAIGRLLLPLNLSSLDLALAGATYTGTRGDGANANLSVVDDQHFTLDLQWPAGLPPGDGPVARLHIMLRSGAPAQTAYLDTAGEYSYKRSGGSQEVVVPGFTRGSITVNVLTDVDDDPLLPQSFALDQNYPNPFNPSTSLAYALSEAGMTRLEIFNLLGQRVITLVDGYQPAGRYTVSWDGRDAFGRAAPSGVYLYRLISGSHVAQMKMTLTK
jgi:hypothetical protein